MDKAAGDKILDRLNQQRRDFLEVIENSRDAKEFEKADPPARPYRYTQDRLSPYTQVMGWMQDVVELVRFAFRLLV
ncbi:hypothetical protein [Pararhizobium sp. DWP3-4]|uniref:hypothetical protein n=1 Tax=Pararhizobium sp. DWP3-4 TaxID=2804565 RepID=UPI003CE7BB18